MGEGVCVPPMVSQEHPNAHLPGRSRCTPTVTMQHADRAHPQMTQMSQIFSGIESASSVTYGDLQSASLRPASENHNINIAIQNTGLKVISAEGVELGVSVPGMYVSSQYSLVKAEITTPSNSFITENTRGHKEFTEDRTSLRAASVFFVSSVMKRSSCFLGAGGGLQTAGGWRILRRTGGMA